MATDLGFRVPRVLVVDPELDAVWLSAVDGEPVPAGVAARGNEDLAARMGAALASLHRSAAVPARSVDVDGLLDDSARHAHELGARIPALARDATRTADDIRRDGVPVHGAPHPTQWIEHDGELGLVDFDGLALGSPELDIAAFQAEVDFEAVSPERRERVNRALRASYESSAGALDEPLLVALRAHERRAKALRTAQALNPDGDRRASKHLARVHEVLH